MNSLLMIVLIDIFGFIVAIIEVSDKANCGPLIKYLDHGKRSKAISKQCYIFILLTRDTIWYIFITVCLKQKVGLGFSMTIARTKKHEKTNCKTKGKKKNCKKHGELLEQVRQQVT